MKTFTKNLVFFAIGLVITTLAFRFLLSYLLQNKHFDYVWIVAVIYGIVVFSMGWFFGKRDQLLLPLYDIGFRFHLTTYVICNSIAKLWFVLQLQSDYENVRQIHYTALYWGVVVVIHFIVFVISRKNAIRGIKKSEIFD
jgi:L-asparagine transporter-like permease